MSRPALVAIWVLATALTTVIAWQIVAAAGEQVSPGPLTPVASPTSSTSSSSTVTSSSTTTSSTTSTTTPGSTTSSTSSSSSSTSPTTTATTAPDWLVKSIPTSGGTVVVSYRQGEVVLDAATPAPGFSVEVDKQGPPDVDVEFEGEEMRVRVRAEWDERLVVEVDENN